MQPFFKINHIKVGFSEHTEVLVSCGKLRLNLQTPELTFTRDLHNGTYDDPYWKKDFVMKNGLRIVAYNNLEMPTDQPPFTFNFPYQDETNYWQKLEVYNTQSNGEYFCGTLTVTTNTIHINGQLQDGDLSAIPVTDRPAIPIEIFTSYQEGKFIPKRKKYSLKEALPVNPTEVYELQFKKGVKEFPRQILDFKNLESLTFYGNLEGDAQRLPSEIGQLKKLHTLHFYGATNIIELPESMQELQNIENFSFRGDLKTIPSFIQQWTKLKELDLSGNQLTTLPDWIGEMPMLKRLSIKYNPFKSLPASLINITNLSYEPKHKKLFMDVTYHSKNKQAIQTELYDFTHHPNLKKILLEEVQKIERFKAHSSFFLDYAHPTVIAEAEAFLPKQAAIIGQSKFGGYPDLPTAIAYPTDENGAYFIFHAQINLADIVHLQSYLPKEGMLYFFVNTEEYAEKPRIFYHPTPDNLQRFVSPENLDFIDDSYQLRQEYALHFYPSIGIPDVNTMVEQPELFDEKYTNWLKEFTWDDYDFFDQLKKGIKEQLEITDPPLKTEKKSFRQALYLHSEPFTQHESPTENAAFVKGGQANEWINLLTVESFNVKDVCIWDAGTLTYSVHKKDLAILDFANVNAMIYSS